MVTVCLFLTFLFVSGALDACFNPAKLSITPQKPLEALSGSCLLIPCKFSPEEKVDFTGNIFGVWIKNDPKFSQNPDNVIYNLSRSKGNYPMKIIGDLNQKNCTTMFFNLTQKYNDDYYFRVENEKFTATASCDPVNIKVKDSAWSPSIKISGGLKDLKEKESVSITCSAWTPCPHSPPELTWNLQQDSQKTEKNPDGTFTTKIQETITLSDTHDGSNISCSVRYPVDGGKRNETAETNLPLSVSYAPKDTSASISPSGLVSPGSWVELSCSSRAKPPVRTFTWFRICKDGPVKVSEGQVYGFNFTEGGEFYCVATNDLGSRKSSVIHLGIKEQSLFWVPVFGGITGLVILAAVVFVIWRMKSKPPTVHQTQHQAPREPASMAETSDIHYGEIDFSKVRPSLETVHDDDGGTELQNVVYSHVRIKNNLTETDDHIYTQVKKKRVPACSS
ncbi:sialic acid-binding Ig-like lectin 7 [Kryptolebias marmoratus]|uniref:sialic acid-binding Ig-like lectin 7 n=1 Tax=Kryptolebias marmoratus TaxID=37003 RepID=UPI0007F90A6B|nr:sialic acid-binding Ig-like lectin 7 [Kryptolebias marmoratus]